MALFFTEHLKAILRYSGEELIKTDGLSQEIQIWVWTHTFANLREKGILFEDSGVGQRFASESRLFQSSGEFGFGILF